MNTDLQKKIDRSICILRNFRPMNEPYYLCYSGGKDSDTIRLLADMAEVNYELHNNHTTVDAPDTVRYIREVMSSYGNVKYITDEDGLRTACYGDKGFIHFPKETMWQLIERKGMPPTRIARYCCEYLKEGKGKGRLRVTGVRKAESVQRAKNGGLVQIKIKPKTNKKLAEKLSVDYEETTKGGIVLNMDNDESRRMVEQCYRTSTTLVNPILDWTDEDVLSFLESKNCKSNPLYEKGYKRIGCIGCPMAGKSRLKELEDFPQYYQMYLNAFGKMIEKHKANWTKVGSFTSPEAVMDRWLSC